jgi:hypothetical protein
MKALLGLVAVIGAIATAASCLRTTSYKCGSSDQCGTGGVCEADTGYCSFTDADCAQGRRYGEFAGTYSNRCVGDLPPGQDGGPGDTVMGDVPMDVPVGACPSTYVAVAGQTHVYRVITAAANWSAQNSACDGDTGTSYLAVPGDQTELTAILAAAGANAWVGITDGPPNTEGSFVTSSGGTFASNSALWETSGTAEPDNDPESGGGNNNGDCVVGINGKLADDNCLNTYVAVCECEP